MGHFGHPLVLVDRDDHEDRRRYADESVSAEAGRPAVECALKTDHCADGERAWHPANDYKVIMTHERSLACQAYR